jgi:DNA-binding NarL/FixJ family response regulator
MSAENRPVQISVVIADDQTLFASSLEIVLDGYGRGEFTVIGIAHNGRECVEIVNARPPDVILMDVRMPEMDGVEAARIIHERHPRIKILMLTTFDDDAYVTQALGAGATGYILKNIQPNELVSCIQAVQRGTMLVSPSVGYRFFSQPLPELRTEPEEAEYLRKLNYLQARFPDLRKREAEVLYLVLQGMDNHMISQTLFIAEQTVKNYTSMIYTKIGVEDRLQAIRLLRGASGMARE